MLKGFDVRRVSLEGVFGEAKEPGGKADKTEMLQRPLVTRFLSQLAAAAAQDQERKDF